MYEQKMCVTADKIYIVDKSVINTRTISRPYRWYNVDGMVFLIPKPFLKDSPFMPTK